MSDFAHTIAQNKDLTTEEQKNAGKPVAGAIDDEHKNFLKTLIGLIETGSIDPAEPKTFLNEKIYKTLNEEWIEKTDLTLMNIAQQVRLIYDFYTSSETPDESPQLQTMVEQLWQMKQQIEEHHNVFKF